LAEEFLREARSEGWLTLQGECEAGLQAMPLREICCCRR
jgi:hypothetical protein